MPASKPDPVPEAKNSDSLLTKREEAQALVLLRRWRELARTLQAKGPERLAVLRLELETDHFLDPEPDRHAEASS
jgi:hypothetical protein